jgi:hypothetical protein
LVVAASEIDNIATRARVNDVSAAARRNGIVETARGYLEVFNAGKGYDAKRRNIPSLASSSSTSQIIDPNSTGRQRKISDQSVVIRAGSNCIRAIGDVDRIVALTGGDRIGINTRVDSVISGPGCDRVGPVARVDCVATASETARRDGVGTVTRVDFVYARSRCDSICAGASIDYVISRCDSDRVSTAT